MSSSSGIPHYLPASMIGGFGVAETGNRSGSLRLARVAVRLAADPDRVLPNQRAETIAKERNAYALENPPPGVDRNIIDRIWDSYEAKLPGAIDALSRGTYTANEWQTVLEHVNGQSARSPDYLVRAAKYLAEQGISAPTRDQLQLERLKTLAATPAFMADCRFALVRRPVDGPRFVVNDKGYASPLQDPETGLANVIFPLSPEIAVLMVVGAGQPGDDFNLGPMRKLTMTPSTVALVNEASWQLSGIQFLIGHPEDAAYIRRLDATKPLEPPLMGPYRGTGDAGLCDWAVMKQVASRLTVFNVNGKWIGEGPSPNG